MELNLSSKVLLPYDLKICILKSLSEVKTESNNKYRHYLLYHSHLLSEPSLQHATASEDNFKKPSQVSHIAGPHLKIFVPPAATARIYRH